MCLLYFQCYLVYDNVVKTEIWGIIKNDKRRKEEEGEEEILVNMWLGRCICLGQKPKNSTGIKFFQKRPLLVQILLMDNSFMLCETIFFLTSDVPLGLLNHLFLISKINLLNKTPRYTKCVSKRMKISKNYCFQESPKDQKKINHLKRSSTQVKSEGDTSSTPLNSFKRSKLPLPPNNPFLINLQFQILFP